MTTMEFPISMDTIVKGELIRGGYALFVPVDPTEEMHAVPSGWVAGKWKGASKIPETWDGKHRNFTHHRIFRFARRIHARWKLPYPTTRFYETKYIKIARDVEHIRLTLSLDGEEAEIDVDLDEETE
jgi:hypothetical protein